MLNEILTAILTYRTPSRTFHEALLYCKLSVTLNNNQSSESRDSLKHTHSHTLKPISSPSRI